MRFLRENKRFIFKLGGNDAWELPYEKEQTEKGNELVTRYVFKTV